MARAIPLVGRLQTMTDGRGVAKTTTYDDFLRPFRYQRFPARTTNTT